MEDAGAQVASPIFIHHPTAGRFMEPHSMAKKRSLPFSSANFTQQQNHPINWSPDVWNWDSLRFVAKPSHNDSANRLNAMDAAVHSGQSKSPSPSRNNHTGEEESLRLQLGGTNAGLGSNVEPVSRPSKRVRSGSPGSCNYPMCQVDDCKEDLSRAKDYHRRHKVCEVHSKATQALVGNQMQRFCQQCSRFHPLLEFDEGKRSCRRRLAGHNRRRRKTQPEESATRVVPTGNQESTDKNGLDIVNLLTVLARTQGNTDERGVIPSPVSDKEQLLQILKKLHTLPLPANIAEKIPILGGSGNSISNQSSSQAQSCANGNISSPPTKNLLAALKATPVMPTTDVIEVQSEGSSRGSDSEKSKSAFLGQSIRFNLQDGPCVEPPIVGGERSSSGDQSPVEESVCHVQEGHPDLTLQLFSSSPEIDSIPKFAADRKYFSSGSSNPSIDVSPSSSPPVAHKLFPVPSIREKRRPGTIPVHPVGTANVSATKAGGCIMPLQLFGGSSTLADNGSSQNSPYQAGYTSSSGSDHSPSSLISDAQDRTGRILFKLFDKDPSHLPGSLRAQVYNWLSNSPSEMESYIRPGCIVLSIYISMSSSAWDELEANLYLCIKSLVEDIDSDFWRDGRFLVHTLKQLASYQDGKVRLSRSLKVRSTPELLSISPVAVVTGQESSVVLRGRNLTIPGTKITCTHTVTYTIEQAAVPTSRLQSDEICLGGFKVYGANDEAFGRCFIEVENGVRGSSFPLIIADAGICQELVLLELEFGAGAEPHDLPLASHVQDSWVSSSREESLHFLNELGWLFQRKRNSFFLEAPAYKLSRFKFLFIFSVEHDFCALVKTLLDILLEINMANQELIKDSFEMLHEIHLLNRAVKRRCMNMVNLLLHYSVVLDSSNHSRQYVFPPNAPGPGGITPLHVAASLSNSDNLVDSLTNDPQEIGMRCWNSTLDSTGLSPSAYALMRNNHSYNDIVFQKLADKDNGQISLSIHDMSIPLELEKEQNNKKLSESKQVLNSCSRCAIAAASPSKRVSGTHGLLQRPFIHSMLAIAAVCVCVCLLFRGAPDIGSVAPFKWEKLEFGTS